MTVCGTLDYNSPEMVLGQVSECRTAKTRQSFRMSICLTSKNTFGARETLPQSVRFCGTSSDTRAASHQGSIFELQQSSSSVQRSSSLARSRYEKRYLGSSSMLGDTLVAFDARYGLASVHAPFVPSQSSLYGGRIVGTCSKKGIFYFHLELLLKYHQPVY